MDRKFYEEMLTRHKNKDIDSEKMWDMRAASFNEAVKTDKSGRGRHTRGCQRA